MMKRIALACAVALSLSLVFGCAPKKPEWDVVKGVMVWPPQPEEPRIAYVQAFHGALDFYEPTFMQFLFGTPPRSVLHKPSAVFASGDRVYVALSGAAAVDIIDRKERKITRISEWQGGKIGLPLGVAVLPDGTIYVSDATARLVQVFDKDFNFKFSFGVKDGLTNPAGLAFSRDHTRLYVVDSKAHDVKVFTPQGSLLFKFGSQGKGPGSFYFPSNIAVSPVTGNLCVVDTQNFRVQIFDKDGKFIRAFGELGDVPGSFSRPKGAAFDSEGHLYISDYAFSNIQLFDEEGQILMWFGSLGTTPGLFQLPAGMFIDEEDRLYVADSLNNRVQVFQYMSEAWKHGHPEEYKKYAAPETALQR